MDLAKLQEIRIKLKKRNLERAKESLKTRTTKHKYSELQTIERLERELKGLE